MRADAGLIERTCPDVCCLWASLINPFDGRCDVLNQLDKFQCSIGVVGVNFRNQPFLELCSERCPERRGL
jgi:hypothetical protein